MDGMSLRETPLLLKSISNYNIEYKYTFSTIPSDTYSFVQRNFNSKSPSKIKESEKYQFFHLLREDKIDTIPLSEKNLLVWSIYPDKSFSEFNVAFEIKDLKKMGVFIQRFFLKLFNHLNDYEKLIITSDHGYFIDSFSWKGLKDFPSNNRFVKEIPNHLQKYCKFINGFWVLLGRYNKIKSGKYVHLRHGGLSFLETIVPLIEIIIE